MASEAVGIASVRCPGCGCRTALSGSDSAYVRCHHCLTPLLISRRRFDVEYAVRERLYPSARRNGAEQARAIGHTLGR
jgi:hypothetical protein